LVGRASLKEIVRESTDLIERLCIEAALVYTSDNRASAAEILGLSRQSLYSRAASRHRRPSVSATEASSSSVRIIETWKRQRIPFGYDATSQFSCISSRRTVWPVRRPAWWTAELLKPSDPLRHRPPTGVVSRPACWRDTSVGDHSGAACWPARWSAGNREAIELTGSTGMWTRSTNETARSPLDAFGRPGWGPWMACSGFGGLGFGVGAASGPAGLRSQPSSASSLHGFTARRRCASRLAAGGGRHLSGLTYEGLSWFTGVAVTSSSPRSRLAPRNPRAL